MITIAVGVPDAYARRAEYVFGVFADQWGLPVRTVRDPAAVDADIRYTALPPAEGDGAVWVRFDERMYAPDCACAAIRHDGARVWARRSADPACPDLVAGAYRLLTFLDERGVPAEERDARGVFRSDALPAARREVAAMPVVDDHAALLLERLRRARPGATANPLPKWPAGKRYAVALTHDTDAITLGAPRELATNLAKLVVRRDRAYADMVADGLRYAGDPTGNPLFGFPIWRGYEGDRGIRGCFFLYARLARIKADINNCKSSVVEQPIDWSLLQRMAADGWEFGFHAPINAKHSIDALARGKAWIEGRLGVPVYGLRHHYWALDWVAPHTTWRRHVNSGFRYDSSIAWRDISGFRAATCHPFRPFDPDRDKALDIYELPASVMDLQVLEHEAGPADGAAAGRETIARVRERGGVAVLDWHTESACDAYVYKGSLPSLGAVLGPLLDDDDAWFATPWQIVEHWHRRRMALASAAVALPALGRAA
jgi:hypothetical protein